MASVLRQAARLASSRCLTQLSAASSTSRLGASSYNFSPSSRNASTSSTIKVQLDSNTGVAIMMFQNPPVNSMSLDFMTEFVIAWDKLELDKSCRGIILTSALPNVFSAGLDIMDMYGTTPEHRTAFWKALQELWLKVYGSGKIVVAAINGASPAGGCLMALSCDYRIMIDNPKYKIGINETKLGIVAPFWFKDCLENTVGYRMSEMSVQYGILYNSAEALKIGLVDQLVPEDKLISTATETMIKWFAIPDYARQISKAMVRKATMDKMLAGREADITNFVTFTNKDSIQKSLGMYMEMLKGRKAK
ncbi:enoyl-CoA delta isomerase 1, mitochondrial [Astyanax mexicanus]|uniref:Enoyl-CoA delta isomerase 1, mitochondrial n=1 Tax=Astyanax mexicanus TaxID=7994 RepID=W5K4N1_ASTMX|nr:enoyl-CoA delta isomerase 1, mitochondrial [Astyanax mexicanus]